MQGARIANGRFRWSVLLGLAALAAPGCGAPIEATTGRIVSDTFNSAAADETFDILVRLPPGYEAETRRYPVVYRGDELPAGTAVFDRIGLHRRRAEVCT